MPITQPHPTTSPKSFGRVSPVVAFLWEGSRVQEGPFQEHQLVIEHPDLQGTGGDRTSWSLEPAAQLPACILPQMPPSRYQLAALAHSKVTFCSADMCWPKATAAPSNFSTAVTRGPVGYSQRLSPGSAGFPRPQSQGASYPG